MNGAIPPLLHVPSCLIEDRDFVFTNFTWHGEVWKPTTGWQFNVRTSPSRILWDYVSSFKCESSSLRRRYFLRLIDPIVSL